MACRPSTPRICGGFVFLRSMLPDAHGTMVWRGLRCSHKRGRSWVGKLAHSTYLMYIRSGVHCMSLVKRLSESLWRWSHSEFGKVIGYEMADSPSLRVLNVHVCLSVVPEGSTVLMNSPFPQLTPCKLQVQIIIVPTVRACMMRVLPSAPSLFQTCK